MFQVNICLENCLWCCLSPTPVLFSSKILSRICHLEGTYFPQLSIEKEYFIVGGHGINHFEMAPWHFLEKLGPTCCPARPGASDELRCFSFTLTLFGTTGSLIHSNRQHCYSQWKQGHFCKYRRHDHAFILSKLKLCWLEGHKSQVSLVREWRAPGFSLAAPAPAARAAHLSSCLGNKHLPFQLLTPNISQQNQLSRSDVVEQWAEVI